MVASFCGSDGDSLLTGSFDHSVRLWDARTGQETLALTAHQGEISQARFDATGTKVLSASVDGSARIWDIRYGSYCSLSMRIKA